MAAITPSPATNNTKRTSTPASPVESTTSQPSGAKRKRTTDPKFYAVKFGFQPGIYHTWNDCLTQVTGFKGAVCTFRIIRSGRWRDRSIGEDSHTLE
ncbi:hypothetical protein ACJ72_03169 [Emergomyces africanus]|uniref:Ribonuclease H1 N-terminal domain-containing protein n=1 Tax=Emergomyces africanus TaxID=1955775 RepID=A0A1B7P0D0_9EURO|nr:hypothetical protein ACJ72_03169 [Emergomyces africanus]